MYHYIREVDSSAWLSRVHARSVGSFERDILQADCAYDPRRTLQLALDGEEDGYSLFTFDDGLVDHFIAAKILESYGRNGIFFIPSGPHKDGHVLGVHRVHYLVYGHDPDVIYKFLKAFVEEADGLSIQDLEKCLEPNRYHFYKANKYEYACKIFLNRYVQKERLSEVLTYLEEKVGRRPKVEDVYASKEQILEMIRMGMVIGCHGHSHNPYSSMSPSQQRCDLKLSKKFVRSLGGDSRYFSYPYGRKVSYGEATKRILTDEEFSYAFSVEDCDISQKSGLLELPRYDCNSIASASTSLESI